MSSRSLTKAILRLLVGSVICTLFLGGETSAQNVPKPAKSAQNAPKPATPVQNAPKAAAPREDVPKPAAPREDVSKPAAPREDVLKTATLREGVPAAEITVATRMIEPFIVSEGGEVTGFSADLWRAIAAELGIKSRFTVYNTLPELLGAVGKGGPDQVGIAAISITAERQRVFDFSQPMFRSGLAIMVPENTQSLDIAGTVFSTQTLKAVGIFLLILLIPAHLIWFLARGRDEGLPISERYVPGIFDAIFWCAESMGGAAQAQPTRVFARIAAVIWVYAGLIFVTYFTAYATTTLTMQSMRGDINDPKDLAGKRVAVVKGSTSARYATGLRARIVNVPDFKTAASTMLAGEADAVIYDQPVMLYYVKNEPRARLAGAAFHAENYGIIFPLGSALRRPVNETLLTLVENGTYANLYKKWFGDDEPPH